MALSRYLEECAERAAGVLGDDVEASVTLRQHGLTLRAGSSSAAAARCDQAEALADAGPCIAAMDDLRVVEAAPDEVDGAWHPWGRQAVDEGFVRALAVPGHVAQDATVALNLYRRRAVPWEDRLVEAAQGYARLIAAAVRLHLEFADLEDAARALGSVPDRSSTVERAVGVVMETNGCTPAEAARLLRAAAERRGVPLEVAAGTVLRSLEVVGSGEGADDRAVGG